jgi:UDP-glucuronate 4-epimerase
MKHVLVTGSAGFIGFHLSRALLAQDYRVTGVDSLNDYYDVALKRARLNEIGASPRFSFLEMDLSARSATEGLFRDGKFDVVCHLAAQAGVRYSLQNPHAYVENNVTAFLHVLEGCRHHPVEHLLFASSSSVYGAQEKTPFAVEDRVDRPISLYAATKLANEQMAHVYAHLYGIPTTGLRFFTVYGPWGRPDMAYYKFTKAILEGKPIEVYNEGRLQRDFTYIDDIVEGLLRLIERPPAAAAGHPAFALHNIGNHQPVELTTFIETLERVLGRTAQRAMLPMQPGDVPATCADVTSLQRVADFAPSTSLETGLKKFATWYRAYHGLQGSA